LRLSGDENCLGIPEIRDQAGARVITPHDSSIQTSAVKLHDNLLRISYRLGL
jgi:hypothetical protein